MEPNKTQEKSNGALIGLVVIVIILIIGGIYMWQTNTNEGATENAGESISLNEAVSSQDAAAIDALGQEAEATNAEAGVDAGAVN